MAVTGDHSKWHKLIVTHVFLLHMFISYGGILSYMLINIDLKLSMLALGM